MAGFPVLLRVHLVQWVGANGDKASGHRRHQLQLDRIQMAVHVVRIGLLESGVRSGSENQRYDGQIQGCLCVYEKIGKKRRGKDEGVGRGSKEEKEGRKKAEKEREEEEKVKEKGRRANAKRREKERGIKESKDIKKR